MPAGLNSNSLKVFTIDDTNMIMQANCTTTQKSECQTIQFAWSYMRRHILMLYTTEPIYYPAIYGKHNWNQIPIVIFNYLQIYLKELELSQIDLQLYMSNWFINILTHLEIMSPIHLEIPLIDFKCIFKWIGDTSIH